MIKVSNVDITPADGDKSQVNIRVEDFSSTARLHVFATHFLSNMPSQMYYSLAKV